MSHNLCGKTKYSVRFHPWPEVEPVEDPVENPVGENVELPENNMLNQDLVEHNALQSQRRALLMQLLGNTTDGAFQRILTPGTGSIKFEIILRCNFANITLSRPNERFGKVRASV